MGVAPPVDALLSWLMEQTLVHLLGGSPMASEMRCVRIVVTAAVSGCSEWFGVSLTGYVSCSCSLQFPLLLLL